MKCLYLVTGSLDPKGTGQTRWKPALNAFAITFARVLGSRVDSRREGRRTRPLPIHGRGDLPIVFARGAVKIRTPVPVGPTETWLPEPTRFRRRLSNVARVMIKATVRAAPLVVGRARCVTLAPSGRWS
jgi:hypothetical protein